MLTYTRSFSRQLTSLQTPLLCACSCHTCLTAERCRPQPSTDITSNPSPLCLQLSRVPDGGTLLSLSHSAVPIGLCLSHDCSLMAVALDDRSVHVWDLGGNLSQPSGVLPPINAPIKGVTFSPAGSLLVVWGQDCTVTLWSVSTAGQIRMVAAFMADSAITCCTFLAAPGGGEADILAAGDAGGAVHFLDYPKGLQE